MVYEEIVSYVEKNLKKTTAKEIKNHMAVEFNILGEGEGAFYIEVKDGIAKVEPYEYYDRDAKVLITGEELVKIVSGEENATESFQKGNFNIEGNINAAFEILFCIKAPAKKTTVKKTAPAKTVKAEKKIVAETKKKNSKIAKDIKK